MAQYAVGTVLEDRYRVDHPIARGGMSMVYRCVDMRLGRAVAVKVLDSRYAKDPGFRSRFRSEARAMAQLNHPNLVNVYDFGQHEDSLFLVMELITGGTLRELLAERGPMPPHAALAVMRAVLTGLSLAHSRGLVHRDIKPDNVLINADHRVKLADFGLVRAVDHTERSTGRIVGTVAYLSPEQVDGSEITPASDVYSAGVVLYELLTGRTPFSGETDILHAYARLDQDVPPPSSAISGVSSLVDALVATATDRDPAARFSDAADFLAAVDDVAAELALPAFTVPVPRNAAAHRAAEVPTDTKDLQGPLVATSVIDAPENPTDTQPGSDDETSVIETSVIDSPTTSTPVGETAVRETAVLGQPPMTQPPAAQPPIAPPPAPQQPAPQQPVAPPPNQQKLVTNRSRFGFLFWLFIAVALAVAVAIGAWWFGSGRYTEVPTILRMERTAAVKTIEDAGFAATTKVVYSNDIPADQAAGTEPPSGEKALEGDQITVLVSQGQPTVPEITPKTSVAEFSAAAKERTLATTTADPVYSDTVPEGGVAKVDPPSGQQVPTESTVIVYPSKGPAPVEVPDLKGMNIDDARSQLDGLGLKLVENKREFDDDAAVGEILQMTTRPGSTAKRGDEVHVTVNAAVAVPDVAGMNRSEAEDALRQLGITLGEEKTNRRATAKTAEELNVAAGTKPDAGTVIDPASDDVALVMPGSVEVPDLEGMTVGDARSALEALNLKLDTFDGWHSDHGRDDSDGDDGDSRVIKSQYPRAGSEVTVGRKIMASL